MSDAIKEFAQKRGVKYLLHFTRVDNLASILQRGLVTRDILTGETGIVFNDLLRLDGTNAVCLSIGFPNYKMFYRLRIENPGVSWVILVIYPHVLWQLPCAFCRTNAASSDVTQESLESRKTAKAFEGMYNDWENKSRNELQIPDFYPTNPQAEVLLLNGVPNKFIYSVIVNNEALRSELQKQNPDVKLFHNNDFFFPRTDYANWK